MIRNLRLVTMTVGVLIFSLVTTLAIGQQPARIASVRISGQSTVPCTPQIGNTTTVTYTVTPNRSANGTTTVAFCALGLPSGVTASFSPATVTANGNSAFPSTILTLTIPAITPGLNSFTVKAYNTETGNCTTAQDFATINGALMVYGPPSFTICSMNPITVNTTPGACNAVVNYVVEAEGVPRPRVTYVFTGATTGSESGTGSGSTFNKGTTTVNVTATNDCGTSVCSFTVTVVDDEDPVIDCPDNITQNNDAGDCGAVVNFVATATDNCPNPAVTYSQNPGTVFPVGTTTVTATATDGSGNTSTCTFTVTVVDDEDPVIDCPDNITQNNDAGECGAVVNFVATATDNCPNPAVTYSQNPGTVFPVGTTTVTATATDGSGNTSTCTFTVTVVDDEDPVIDCPDNITQNNDAGDCGAVVNFVATATDNCPNPAVTYSQNPGTVFPVGTTTVTATATDGSGNTTTCIFTVTVVDDENPVIDCPDNITQNNDAGDCGAVVNYTTPVGTDNCSGSTTTQVAGLSSGSVFPVGTTTNTFTVRDRSGNETSCSFNVTVIDDENPTITCTNDITVNNDAGVCGAVVTYTAPVGTDNCAGSTTTQIAGLASGSVFPVGTTTNTFRVTDASRNSTLCSFTVTVTDTEAPSITCPGNITQPTDPNIGGAVVNFEATASDNCPNPVVTYSKDPGTLFPVGATIVTATATDASNNTSTCTFTVTVTEATDECNKNPNNEKVYVCHNGRTICVSINALQAHLDHGDYAGPCTTETTPAVASKTRKPAATKLDYESFNVTIAPNPSRNHFTITLPAHNIKDAISLKVSDASGKMIESTNNLRGGQTIRLGGNYRPGLYIVEMIQGANRKQLKLIKQID